ncbi:MAG: cyclic nucleotide-binding domain-containing protein [Anaerolineales bacterium]|nr:cyclic nucleotide-binding domain-containing protein [Anaerolineales bacterium]
MTKTHRSSSGLKNYLSSIPMFEGISEQTLALFARSSHVRCVEKGETLFTQTDPADTVYIVRSGCISLFLATPDGRELVINEMYPGDCFGELSLITEQPRSTGAMAHESSEIIVIPHDRFMEGLRTEPELMRRVLQTTAERLRVSSERESALAFLNSSARISRVLLQLDRHAEEEGAVYITQEKLAHYVGLARQTVAKTLGQWRRAGWIRTGRGKIEIVDRAALGGLTEGIKRNS